MVGELRSTGDCMEFRLNYANGVPMLSAAGQPLDGQSFSINPDIPSSEWMPVEEEENMWIASGFDIQMQSEIMSIPITLPLQQGAIAIPIDQGEYGYLGGALAFEDALILTNFDMVGIPETHTKT